MGVDNFGSLDHLFNKRIYGSLDEEYEYEPVEDVDEPVEDFEEVDNGDNQGDERYTPLDNPGNLSNAKFLFICQHFGIVLEDEDLELEGFEAFEYLTASLMSQGVLNF